MLDKKFFLALTLSLFTVLGLQYFFSGKVDKQQTPVQQGGSIEVSQQPVAGQPIKVAATQELFRPLNMDVKFEEKPSVEAEVLTDVSTKYYTAVFSNYGAALTSFELKKYGGKDGFALRTIDQATDIVLDRASSCFMVALEENTPFQYKFLSKQNKTIDNHEVVEVSYSAETEFWNITKIYTLHQDSYKIDMDVKFEPAKQEGLTSLRARILVRSPFVREVESRTANYLARARDAANAPLAGEILNNTISVFVFNEVKNSVEVVDLSASKDLAWHWGTPKVLFGAEDKYFVHSMIDDSEKFVQRAYIKKIDEKNITTIFEGPEINEAKSFKFSFYMGPKVLDAMTDVDPRLVELLSFGWLSWLCKLLLQLLSWLFSLIGNYGWAIVVMTILLRLPFIPLSIYSRKRMEEYQRFQPTIQRIRQKYRQDMRMQNEELVKFHKDHNLSTTTPLLGCLPLLIQMPILFALYRVLGNYLDLYQAPFFGWIHDLSAKDPFYVIPIIMGLTMIWQQAMTPSSDEKQKIMMYFVSVVMTVVFAGFPVGLVLYWTMNNILTLMEDYFRKYVLRY